MALGVFKNHLVKQKWCKSVEGDTKQPGGNNPAHEVCCSAAQWPQKDGYEFDGAFQAKPKWSKLSSSPRLSELVNAFFFPKPKVALTKEFMYLHEVKK